MTIHRLRKLLGYTLGIVTMLLVAWLLAGISTSIYANTNMSINVRSVAGGAPPPPPPTALPPPTAPPEPTAPPPAQEPTAAPMPEEPTAKP